MAFTDLHEIEEMFSGLAVLPFWEGANQPSGSGFHVIDRNSGRDTAAERARKKRWRQENHEWYCAYMREYNKEYYARPEVAERVKEANRKANQRRMADPVLREARNAQARARYAKRQAAKADLEKARKLEEQRIAKAEASRAHTQKKRRLREEILGPALAKLRKLGQDAPISGGTNGALSDAS